VIGKITKGIRVRGLLEYLWGPGKAEEHTNPRIVAGYDDPAVLAPGRDAADPDRVLLAELAAKLDAPQEALGDRGVAEYVFQCSLSLPSDDREVSDDEWQRIAEQFVQRMGLAGDEERAGCRWIAVHHGRSVNGNDHIHIVVTRATEDGEAVWMRGEYKLAQRVIDELEDEFNLLKRTPGRAGATPRQPTSRAEVDQARTSGDGIPDRDVLRLEVRAALAGARDESDWVSRMKAAGLLVSVRTDRQDDEVIVGYAVALPPERSAAKPRWISGSKLDGDLSIRRVRQRWSDAAPLRAAEWRGVQPRESVALGSAQRMEVWRSTAAAIEDVSGRLAAVPAGSPEWPGVARASADLLARVATVAEPSGIGPVSQAADILARASAPRRLDPPATDSRLAFELGRISDALLLAGRARDTGEAALVLAVMVQTARLVVLLAELRAAQRQVHAAGAAQAAASRLMPLISRASTVEAGAGASRQVGETVPKRGTVRPETGRPAVVRRERPQAER
jgi:hypothetical protein